jgi:hypothetical protein
MKKMRIKIITAVLLCLIGMWVFSDPFPQDRLEELKVGMTREQVKKVIGNPTRNSGGLLTYSRFMKIGSVDIFFDENDRYTGYRYERL